MPRILYVDNPSRAAGDAHHVLRGANYLTRRVFGRRQEMTAAQGNSRIEGAAAEAEDPGRRRRTSGPRGGQPQPGR